MNYKSNTPTRIFVVEDDPMYLNMVKYAMEMNPDHEVYTFTTGKACLDKLYLNPQIVSLDYTLPDMNGEEVLKRIKANNKNTKTIILSGQKDIDTAIDLLRKGADDYINKGPQMKKRLFHILSVFKKNLSLEEEVESLREELGEKYNFKKMLRGASPVMEGVFSMIRKASQTDITVSITGETGTGKEVVAKSIHYSSKHKGGRFVAVNMSAIPRDLLESELFGHEKGAFTGATTRKQGKFELANGGTLFLDEIGDMDLMLQAKLLRALQEREITRVGGTKTIKINTRIVVATHKDLLVEMQQGRFREDLYYRVLGLPIKLPPLRDRGHDILILAKHFLEEFCKKNDFSKKTLAQTAKDKLLNHKYPGNVRELKATVELAAVMAGEGQIKGTDIQFHGPKKPAFEIPEGEMSLQDYIRQIIYRYLDLNDRNVMKVAKKLQIGKSTIYKILKEDEAKRRGAR